MIKKRTLAFTATLLALASAGCNSFLTGDNLSNNPNVPTNANPNQLFIGVEVAVMGTWETYPMMLLPIWAQQVSGGARQGLNWSQLQLGTDNFASDLLWNPFYGPGGLADIRRVVDGATTDGNLKLVGQAKVLEALYAGTAADIWGDVPYDSAGKAFPTFDTQAAVYAHVQATLDTAITDLGGAGSGAENDFYFGDDFAKWIAVAHTLKARFYMHTAEKSDLSYDNAILAQVVSEAAKGIADPASNLETKHSGSTGEQNLFYAYYSGIRQGDLAPSQLHINIATQLNDPDVLAADYEKNKSGQYVGTFAGAAPPLNVSSFGVPIDASQEIVSYTENILLSAEAHYRLGQTGVALTELNTEHAKFGDGATPIPSGANGVLIAIIDEKYARDFLDPNVLFDYLRTCVPNLQLPTGHGGVASIPARMLYGFTEQTANPNIPADPIANANWPKHPTDPNGAVCVGQVNRAGP